ncbi:T9SS type A sorting domain-containing protein [Chryseobacterium wangxinyae]|uniref:T9SS type A sorting domain-containing protein n=1 Tax=Chryseobacterium sp. CY353 TaxID=2997334 RepID=UPI0022703B7A|nr:T9SS type A sorting domain-containing protein [Chryseobacterium sp. CY353]MCY0971020.1 T9SS type A sorting domain-containing protein [Chryseobacterium sp. CY353]
MKKILFTVLVSCFSVVYSQNLNFTDPKFKALILSSNSTNGIAKNLSGNSIAIDANGDGEIQTAEAQQVKILTLKQDENFKYIDPLGDIWDPNNINTTYFNDHLPNGITDVLLFPNVEELYLSDVLDATISFVNNSKIRKVKETDYLIIPGITIGSINSYPINLTLDNCSALQNINDVITANHPIYDNYHHGNIEKLTIKNCSQINSNANIEYSYLKELFLENSSISVLNIVGSMLDKININNDTSITKVFTYDSSNPQYMPSNNFVDFTANNCPNLLEIRSDADHYYNNGQYFNPISISACASLKKILGVSTPTLDFSNSGLINLEELDCSYYNRTGYDHGSGGFYLYSVGNLTSLNLSGLPKLKILKAFNQPITNANFSGATNLENIDITNSCGFMNTLDVSNLTNLHTLKANTLSSGCGPWCVGSEVLKNIIAENCTALVNLNFDFNSSLETLNLYNCSSLQSLEIPYFYYNQYHYLNSLNIKKCYSLKTLKVSRTQLTSIDASDCSLLEDFYLNDVPTLQYANIKNNSIETSTLFYNYSNNLSMCVDSSQLASLQNNYPDINFTANCSNSLTSIWNGTTWSNGIPNASVNAIISAPYSTASNSTFAAANIIINNGGVLEITSGNTINAADVTVKNGGNLIQRDGSALNYTDTFKVLKSGASALNKYAFWSSPVALQDLTAIYPNATPSFITEYKTATDYFVNAASTISLFSKGYSIKTPAVSNVVFTGTPNNGSHLFAMSTAGNGYNLVGNPYPSNLDLPAFYNANLGRISNTFYFWDNTSNNVTVQGGATTSNVGYATYNPVSQIWTPAPNITIIPTENRAEIGQGFIIKAINAADTSLSFTNDMRTATSGTFFNKNNSSTEGKFWLKLNSSYNTNNTIAVAYLNSASDAFDQYDSKAIGMGSDAFYTMADAQKLVIQGKAGFDITDIVSVGTKHFQNANFTISLVQKEGIFNNGQAIYLHDKDSGTYTNLQNAEYSFTNNAGEFANRFEIVYKLDVLATAETTRNSFEVYREGDDFFVRNDKNIESVEVFDAAGRRVLKINSNAKLVRIKIDAKGVYFLKAVSAGKEYSKKIIK